MTTPPLPPHSLTLKEKKVLEFIENYIQKTGIAPSYIDIQTHFQLASIHSVQRYLKQLIRKEYLYVPQGNQKRAIRVLKSANAFQKFSPLNDQPLNAKKGALDSPPTAESLSLPLLGRVAAGRPIEAHLQDEFIQVPSEMVPKPNKTFALQVVGQSMIEDGILEDDIILVEKRIEAQNGETIVALIENEATVKKFFLHADSNESKDQTPNPCIELRPANNQMSSFWLRPEQVQIQGVVVGLLRRFF